MAFSVIHQVAYYAQSAHEVEPRTPEEWNAYRYARAVKTGDFGNGYCTISGQRINAKNAIIARQLFGSFIVTKLRELRLTDTYLVPVPSKDSCELPEFRSLAMLRAALPKWAGRFLPIVHYTEKLTPASQGGGRGFGAVYPNIAVTRRVPRRDVVIIDDVLTSGGSALATRKRLVEAGHDVRAVVVCGRTTHSKVNVFAGGTEMVDERAEELDYLR